MRNKKLFIAHYHSKQQTDDAVKKLKNNGYDIRKLSVIGNDCYTEEHVLGYHTFYDKIEKWISLGLLLVIAVSGAMFASVYFFNLGISHPYFKIPIELTAAAVILGLLFPLMGLAFSKNTSIKYKIEIKSQNYRLYTRETNSQIEKMRTLLEVHIPKENSIDEKENQITFDNECYEL